MSEFQYLNHINSPADIKKLSAEELEILAHEVREELIQTVSKNGGHLAPNLGVVELSIALHRVFDSPNDQIVWDVGHQSYTHKLLTGRYKDFHTLRTEGGLSGFLRPNESEHDIFYSGHSSTSISSAYGLAIAKKLNGDNHSVIAVIGDGALTGGLAYEGLNNAGRTKTNLIVILNDNEMSISKNVGSMARYLAVIRSKPEYYKMKQRVERRLNYIPFLGKPIARSLFRSKSRLKNLLYKSTIFEDMGFRYMGPIDGHNITQLTSALESAKLIGRPVLLHINTTKGKGYDFAEQKPSRFHGISKFDINTGEPLSSGTNFSSEFGSLMTEFAEKDNRICAITAAMDLGTGLDGFSQKFPERFFDVGIAEEHAITFASGLAKNGKIPVFAVYSTFLQRCYDQLMHDASLQGEKIVIAVDRAGFVGEDGETHQGIFDIALMNSIPNLTMYSPSSYLELKYVLGRTFYQDKGVSVVRYPRGSEPELPDDYELKFDTYTIYGNPKAETVLVTFGRLFGTACKAKKQLAEKGIDVVILKLNRIKPIDRRSVSDLVHAKQVYFFEEGVRIGGIGEHFGYILAESDYRGDYILTAVENRFVEQAPVSSQLHKNRLDAEGMVSVIEKGRQNCGRKEEKA